MKIYNVVVVDADKPHIIHKILFVDRDPRIALAFLLKEKDNFPVDLLRISITSRKVLTLSEFQEMLGE